MADGGGYYKGFPSARRRGSRKVRLLALPPRDDERMWIRQAHRRCQVPAQGRVSAARQDGMTIRPARETDFPTMWEIFQRVVAAEDTYVFAADTTERAA